MRIVDRHRALKLTMWLQYRKWKHVVFWPLVSLAGFSLHGRELSPLWYAGVAVTLALGIAYLAEEVFWMARGKGRPCEQCGQYVQMKSFRLQTNCPHCEQQIE